MNEYIEQLIELIQLSIDKGEACLGCKEDEDDIEYIDEYADQYIHGTPVKISCVTGIEKMQFPPADQLSPEQTSQLLNAIEDLLLTYNWEFVFPENVSDSIKYGFISDQWDSKQIHCKQGMVQIETCRFNDDNCPFPSHCKICDKFKDDKDSEHTLCKGKVDFDSLVPSHDNADPSIRKDIEKYKTLMRNPNKSDFIPGIHNYCDGRCNKCAFTQRCSSFAMQTELNNLEEEEDGEDYDKKLMIILKATTEFIEEELTRRGVDPKETIEELSQDEERTEKQKPALLIKAESYAEKVKRWLESNQREIESHLALETGSMHDNFESIVWFQLFIPAKISRALSIFDIGVKIENDYDANGSAKIALLAIDECLWAWENLMHYLPRKEDSILNILSHLSQLRNGLEETFPKARSFQRPGFDTAT